MESSTAVDNDQPSSMQQSTSTSPSSTAAPPRTIDLVICNVCKVSNIRSLLLSAAAFGCRAVYVVGQKRSLILPEDDETTNVPLPVLQQQQLKIHRFDTWDDCTEYLKLNRIHLIGIEIDERSKCLNDDYDMLSNSIALMAGNEGQGIHPKHLKDCDEIVRIPQYGVGTASFNVTVATTMVLSSFHYHNKK
mmetsp:Transcript_25271/g.70810  ORF Transcript_25271/g.70810 Transcript_25271/m.70810 type:complete len:191 (+) Transcript_25271:75-647(+)